MRDIPLRESPLDIYPLCISCIRYNKFHVMQTQKDLESTPGKHNTRESEKAPFYASGNIIEYNGMRGDRGYGQFAGWIKSRVLCKKVEQSDLSRTLF